ncbi:acetyl-CoA carboxylase carboxyltransferase subunit alpha [Nonomuraea sp. NPDC050783]|uniref:acetyl-CoA carboxylase carboxyltransferase subunit alpha n=1 Tax=Nonomuraea sp. NPDC050783 TaxID=3154634 RepID=UPI00346502D3
MTDLFTAGPATGWSACPGCRALVYNRRLEERLRVCPECGHHARLTARERIGQLLDPGTAVPVHGAAVVVDPLEFTDGKPYTARLLDGRARTGLEDAVECVRGAIDGRPVVVAAMDFRFMGGSLGVAVGERIAGAAEVALRERTPLLVVSSSGGARMQEGALALMQMAKTSQALAALDEAGVLHLSLTTDPTYGGVAASYASLGDVIIAEPGARMGFAGPRVIEQTIGQQLPEGFQTAEFLLEHGLIDDVQPRPALRGVLSRLLSVQRGGPAGGAGGRLLAEEGSEHGAALIRDHRLLPEVPAWECVRLARNAERPTTLEYLSHVLDWFVELHGDRMGRDCPAVVGGLGAFAGRPVVVVGHQKGHTTHELVARNFGMPSPEGYRKAARLMRLAAKLGLPVVTLIDTPGAYPGMEAEERGQAGAIAENLRLMSGLPVPVVSVVIGEGGSGGALALGVANRVLAFSNAVYSVISPEGCASILWRDASAAPAAAAALRVQARELLRLGIVDGVLPEPEGGTQAGPVDAADTLRRALTTALNELLPMSPGQLVRDRRRRFRNFGRNAE